MIDQYLVAIAIGGYIAIFVFVIGFLLWAQLQSQKQITFMLKEIYKLKKGKDLFGTSGKSHDDLALENYKDCKSRGLSIMYSIADIIEHPYCDVASGKDESVLNEDQLTKWQGMVLDVASHIVESEYENKVSGNFWN